MLVNESATTSEKNISRISEPESKNLKPSSELSSIIKEQASISLNSIILQP